MDAKGERIIINYPSPDLLPDQSGWRKLISLSGTWCWQMYAARRREKSLHSGAAGGRDDRVDGDITPQDISELVALSDHALFQNRVWRA